jgi:hypothetical protein
VEKLRQLQVALLAQTLWWFNHSQLETLMVKLLGGKFLMQMEQVQLMAVQAQVVQAVQVQAVQVQAVQVQAQVVQVQVQVVQVQVVQAVVRPTYQLLVLILIQQLVM